VGKTSLVHRYVYDMFGDDYLSTVGAKMVTKKSVFEFPEHDTQVELKMLIWDIAGQKIFGTVHNAYYRGAEAALMVTDVTRRNTFETIVPWVSELYGYAGQVPVLLLANKIDLEDQREVSPEEIKKIAAGLGVNYYLTSAKENMNLDKAFETIGNFLAEKSI